MSFILRLILLLLILRALWHLFAGIRRGIQERRTPGSLNDGVALSRDPVCGTYVVPGRALALRDGGLVRYFCSERCRDEFAREPRHAR
jgi:YHS domain-containing protein